MQEEVTQKTVTFCIRTTKVTADLLKKVLAAYLRHQKQKSVEKKAKKNQPKQGKVTVKELAKQNAGMVNIEITNKNIKSFERYARKYGINYACNLRGAHSRHRNKRRSHRGNLGNCGLHGFALLHAL